MPTKTHRARIEAEHNEGIPLSDWETFEEIIDGFIRDFKDVRLCAKAYGLPIKELEQWLEKRKPKGLNMAAYSKAVAARESVVKASTVRVRRHRGMDPITAKRKPIMPRSESATKAACARWGKGF